MMKKTMIAGSLFIALLLAGRTAQAQATGQEQDSWNDETGVTGDQSTAWEGNAGVASYNIDDGQTADTQDGAWRNEGGGFEQQTEPINVYSGRQEGNNVIRTIQVPLPDGSGTFSMRTYEPH